MKSSKNIAFLLALIAFFNINVYATQNQQIITQNEDKKTNKEELKEYNFNKINKFNTKKQKNIEQNKCKDINKEKSKIATNTEKDKKDIRADRYKDITINKNRDQEKKRISEIYGFDKIIKKLKIDKKCDFNNKNTIKEKYNNNDNTINENLFDLENETDYSNENLVETYKNLTNENKLKYSTLSKLLEKYKDNFEKIKKDKTLIYPDDDFILSLENFYLDTLNFIVSVQKEKTIKKNLKELEDEKYSNTLNLFYNLSHDILQFSVNFHTYFHDKCISILNSNSSKNKKYKLEFFKNFKPRENNNETLKIKDKIKIFSLYIYNLTNICVQNKKFCLPFESQYINLLKNAIFLEKNYLTSYSQFIEQKKEYKTDYIEEDKFKNLKNEILELDESFSDMNRYIKNTKNLTDNNIDEIDFNLLEKKEEKLDNTDVKIDKKDAFKKINDYNRYLENTLDILNFMDCNKDLVRKKNYNEKIPVIIKFITDLKNMNIKFTELFNIAKKFYSPSKNNINSLTCLTDYYFNIKLIVNVIKNISKILNLIENLRQAEIIELVDNFNTKSTAFDNIGEFINKFFFDLSRAKFYINKENTIPLELLKNLKRLNSEIIDILNKFSSYILSETEYLELFDNNLFLNIKKLQDINLFLTNIDDNIDINNNYHLSEEKDSHDNIKNLIFFPIPEDDIEQLEEKILLLKNVNAKLLLQDYSISPLTKNFIKEINKLDDKIIPQEKKKSLINYINEVVLNKYTEIGQKVLFMNLVYNDKYKNLDSPFDITFTMEPQIIKAIYYVFKNGVPSEENDILLKSIVKKKSYNNNKVNKGKAPAQEFEDPLLKEIYKKSETDIFIRKIINYAESITFDIAANWLNSISMIYKFEGENIKIPNNCKNKKFIKNYLLKDYILKENVVNKTNRKKFDDFFLCSYAKMIHIIETIKYNLLALMPIYTVDLKKQQDIKKALDEMDSVKNNLNIIDYANYIRNCLEHFTHDH